MLKGNEEIEKTLKLTKQNSSNLFEKRSKLNEKEDEKEEGKNDINTPVTTVLLADMIQDKSNDQSLLLDIISGNKEEYKKKEPKKKK